MRVQAGDAAPPEIALREDARQRQPVLAKRGQRFIATDCELGIRVMPIRMRHQKSEVRQSGRSRAPNPSRHMIPDARASTDTVSLTDFHSAE
jgi:hypothetical protein